ncbi:MULTISPECIES: LytR C-terminal domain-containing protein [unclassified Cryobacterium]|uniref:LytR C-terminal domain-containing protein n=1 Tax=unclassified Cryobacterium TaxID=2649013 RepID=UPI00106BF6B7|nr:MULTISPECIES: LytR C-terminal domain-containing protein [unclassified Cryobacterium]TFD11615.1 LytR family transcriptional regulator [Cryobacterium sp. TMT4-10]TFD22338.1 LytR family transcriptional regulator [Cryobacterium sp. TMT2-23]
MPTSYPKDRFDHLPHHLDRVGAHRAPQKKGRHWVAFWWALGATALLIGLGVVGLALLNNNLNISLPGTATASASATSSAAAAAPSATTTPTPAAAVDPSLSVTVLNGTPGAGVAKAVGETLTTAGWTVDTLGNADTEDVATTTVYYADAGLEGAARGVAESLPGSRVRPSSDYADSGADLTVVVGADYVPAG